MVTTLLSLCPPFIYELQVTLFAILYHWFRSIFSSFFQPGAICGLSLLLVVILAPRVFLRVLWFSSLHKNQHSKFQFDLESVDKEPLRGIGYAAANSYLFYFVYFIYLILTPSNHLLLVFTVCSETVCSETYQLLMSEISQESFSLIYYFVLPTKHCLNRWLI